MSSKTISKQNTMYNLLKKFDGGKLISDDEEVEVPFKINNLSNIPILPEINGLKPVLRDTIIDYYNSLTDGMRICKINGQNFMSPEDACYSCDYCNILIDTENSRYICNDCHLDMCHMCFEERTEEDAIKNGAQNYHLRKEKLNRCQNEHPLLEIKPDELENLNIFEITNFGDMGDWVPIYQLQRPTKTEIIEFCKNNDIDVDEDRVRDDTDDGEYIFVHQNLNRDSDNYQKFALSTTDDHGRFGIYSIDSIKSFNGLKKNIEKHYKEMLEHAVEGGWDAYYNNVIVLLMDEFGYMYHFG